MDTFIPSGAVTAIALIIYFFISSKSRKPLYEEKPIHINEVTEWRHRLGITVETACELLGVPEDTFLGLESGKYDITKRTKLALLACELAYISAEQHIKGNPKAFPNGQYRGYSIFHARKKIVSDILNEGKNGFSFPLIITIAPKSLIHYIK